MLLVRLLVRKRIVEVILFLVGSCLRLEFVVVV